MTNSTKDRAAKGVLPTVALCLVLAAIDQLIHQDGAPIGPFMRCAFTLLPIALLAAWGHARATQIACVLCPTVLFIWSFGQDLSPAALRPEQPQTYTLNGWLSYVARHSTGDGYVVNGSVDSFAAGTFEVQFGGGMTLRLDAPKATAHFVCKGCDRKSAYEKGIGTWTSYRVVVADGSSPHLLVQVNGQDVFESNIEADLPAAWSIQVSTTCAIRFVPPVVEST